MDEGRTCGVSEWYNGRSVLVTGATGFMGKVLVEKLLRSCTHLKNIYVLVRPKLDLMPEERLQKEILNVELFDILRRDNPEVLKKVIAIRGDIMSPNLGISAEDKSVLTEAVSVVFHSAATVKFNEALKISVAMNIVGPEMLLELCREMKKLDALVHVSTAYCNCNLSEVDEKFYPPPMDPKELIKYVESVDDSTLENMTEELIHDRPNTYTFTKAIAEHVLQDNTAVPLAIVRPSIVTASWRDPVSGWVDNLNGPTGLFVGAGKGVVRSILCHKRMVADFIPVDVAINLMICVAWYTGINRPKTTRIYNCTSGTTNPLTWADIETVGKRAMLAHPFSGVLWYPGGSFKSCRMYNDLCCFLFHKVPAYLVDICALVSGKRARMVRVQSRLSKAMSTLEYFSTKEWKFISNNMYSLWELLSERDRRMFNFDIRSLNWSEYITNYHLGTRKYILKEDMDTLPTAKKQLNRLKIVHYTIQGIFLLSIFGLFLQSSTISNCLYSILAYIWLTCSYIFT